MYRFPELNRHTVGIPALLLLIGAMGVMGSPTLQNYWRPVSHPLMKAMQTASNQSEAISPKSWDSAFLSQLGQAPLTEHRSAAPQASNETIQPTQNMQSQEQNAQAAPAAERAAERAQNATQPAADANKSWLGMAASAVKEWSDDDWRIAAKAVAEHRSASKGPEKGASSSAEPEANAPLAEQRSSAQSPNVWRAPEEIAGKKSR